MTPAQALMLQTMYAPWTIRGPVLDPDGSAAFVIEIEELPGFIVAAETKDEAIHQFTPALRTHLQAYLDAHREIPKPDGPSAWAPGLNKIAPPADAAASPIRGLVFAFS